MGESDLACHLKYSWVGLCDGSIHKDRTHLTMCVGSYNMLLQKTYADNAVDGNCMLAMDMYGVLRVTRMHISSWRVRPSHVNDYPCICVSQL